MERVKTNCRSARSRTAWCDVFWAAIRRIAVEACTGIAIAAAVHAAGGPDPLGARQAAIDLVAHDGLKEARRIIAQMVRAVPPIVSPYRLSYLAELMKLTGDSRAPEFYQRAVSEAAGDPSVELLEAEYFRNFRGPLQPIVGEAETHLFQTSRKLACLAQIGQAPSNANLPDQLSRSIVSLYERDGLPVFSWIGRHTNCDDKGPGLSVFFSAGVRGGEGITDLDSDSDIRDLTSAAAYSQALRLTLGPLSTDLLRQFLRTVTPFEDRNRIRARYRGARADLFYNYRHSGDAAITYPDLRDPAPLSNQDLVAYNPLKLSEFGVSLGDTFHLPGADAALEATYSVVHRTGLVDYLPDAVEDIHQGIVKAALSRPVGPDRIYGDFTFVDQSISPQNTPYQNRGRQIYAGTVRYHIYRLGSGGYGRIFRDTRGFELYGGAKHDHENFGYAAPALVNRDDYFGGAALRGIRKRIDLSIQPTWFTYSVPQDLSRNSKQFRVAGYGMIRLVDEERSGPDLPPAWRGWHLGFVHLTVPVQSDSPQQGLAAFADRKAGAELSAKWFTTAHGATTFLGSARYDIQQFTNLNRTFSLFTLGLTMGF